MPTTFNGSLQPAAEVIVDGDGTALDDRPGRLPRRFRHLERHVVRRPVLAGEIAQALFTSDEGLADYSCDAALDRCWLALASTIDEHRPVAT